MTKKAIYAGSFDPPTRGHQWMMFEGASLFDELIVLIADNPDKKPLIPAQDRSQLIKDMAKGVENISVDIMAGGLLVDYAFDHEIEYLIRGIRNTNDFLYEKDMMEINSDLSQLACRSIYLLPPSHLCHVSSSLVKSLLKVWDGRKRIHLYVPPCVDRYIKDAGL